MQHCSSFDNTCTDVEGFIIFNQVYNENPGLILDWRMAGGRAYPKWRQTEVSAQ